MQTNLAISPTHKTMKILIIKHTLKKPAKKPYFQFMNEKFASKREKRIRNVHIFLLFL